MKKFLSIFGAMLLTLSMTLVFTACENKRPQIKIVLEDGREMTFILYRDYAEETVNHFLALVKEDYYDGVAFSDFQSSRILLGNYKFNEIGDLDEKGNVDTITGEFELNGHYVKNNPLLHELGVLSMYNGWGDYVDGASRDSASNIFFINTNTNTSYNGRYATFGKISGTESLEVLKEIMADELTAADNYAYFDLNEEYKITLPSIKIIIKDIEIIKG
jgi:cyclophilin family peptidyl-prolyl cis-trans isomerase